MNPPQQTTYVRAEKPKNKSKPKPKKPKAPRQANAMSISSAPSAISTRVSSGRPSISQSAKSSRVVQRELILASVAGSTAFTVQNFLHLNPGLSTVFPWLSTIAVNWEQYRCHKLRACWVPIAPTSTQGDILLSPNYDSSDPQPVTETQAANTYGAVSNSCWQPFCIDFDQSAMMGLGPRRYVRNCAVAGDLKTFDVGTLAVCSVNETGTSAVGKLYFEYDFEFFIPQLDPSPATTPLSTSLFTRNTTQTFTSATAAYVQYATTAFDPLNIGPAVAGVFTPPAGCYRIFASVSVTDNTSEAFAGNMLFLKNGNILAPQVQCTFAYPSGIGANAEANMCLEAIVPCNGTDTFGLFLTLVGAAGILSIEGGDAQLVVSLA